MPTNSAVRRSSLTTQSRSIAATATASWRASRVSAPEDAIPFTTDEYDLLMEVAAKDGISYSGDAYQVALYLAGRGIHKVLQCEPWDPLARSGRVTKHSTIVNPCRRVGSVKCLEVAANLLGMTTGRYICKLGLEIAELYASDRQAARRKYGV